MSARAGVARPKNYRGAKQEAALRARNAKQITDEAFVLACVRHVLRGHGKGRDALAGMTKAGAKDADVRAAIGDALGIQGGMTGPAGPGGPFVEFWGGKAPRITIRDLADAAKGRKGPARTIAGAELVRAVRWLFKIPAPGERWQDPRPAADPKPKRSKTQRSAFLPRRPKRPRTPAPERAVAAGGHIKKCLSVDWHTPPELLDRVRLVLTGDVAGQIPLDPFTATHNPTGAARFYTIRENGLLQPWGAPTFVNPPYGRALRPALAKIVREAATWHGAIGPMPIVALLPCSRWEQGYMHELLRAACCVCFVRKRIKFVKAATGDQVGGTPMASMFLGFNVDAGTFGEAFRDVGLCLAMSRI